jgi:hypothetical protein
VRQNDRDTDRDRDVPPDLGLVRALHAVAAVGLLGAGALWLLHYPLRPPCTENYVHFDLGIPALVGGVCLVLGAWQAWRVRAPTRHGMVAAGLTLVALAAGALGVEALHRDLTGMAWDCWTF